MATSRTKTSSAKASTSTAAISAAAAAPAKKIPTTSPVAPTEVPDSSVVNVVKKKELIEKIAETTGVKKGLTKQVIEALLAEVGDILQDGGELNVPPLGKLSVNRTKDVSNAYIHILKLRRAKGMLQGAEDKATAADEASSEE